MIKKWSEFSINELVGVKRIKDVEKFYKRRCNPNIHHPDTVGWLDKQSQDSRFEIFTQFINEDDSILDYGCGVGDLYKYLQSKYEKFEYLGVDIQKGMIENAYKKYPDATFKPVRGIEEIKEKFDWTVASGVFTINMNRKDVLNFFRKASNISTKGVMANFLRTSDLFSKIDTTMDVDSLSPQHRYTQYNMGLLKKYLEKNLRKELICIDEYKDIRSGDRDFTLILRKQS